ncbi:hypothetical protein E4U42_001604 [Claviceps africana]|uniref:Uncharacterized protein n=1 Tax=Claviceps africana TaxID=83212 RepID=A0A8K0J8Z4_9HYPO|nr:hypothetical protein E4U42_001604 [Claviceps africana]
MLFRSLVSIALVAPALAANVPRALINKKFYCDGGTEGNDGCERDMHQNTFCCVPEPAKDFTNPKVVSVISMNRKGEIGCRDGRGIIYCA